MNTKPIYGIPTHTINTNGDVYSSEGIKLEVKKRGNYKFVCLYVGKKKQISRSITRIMYETFYEPLKQNEISYFKDGNDEHICLENIGKKIRRTYRDIKHDEIDTTKQWKPIPGYTQYIVSEYGDVYSLNAKILLKPSKAVYYAVTLANNKKNKFHSVHSLVYRSFVGEIKEGNVIDHIDRNKFNNHVSNLREATTTENCLNKVAQPRNNLKILQKSLEGTVIKCWNNWREIILDHPSYKKCTLLDCCAGQYKSLYGFKWEYEQEYKVTDTNSFHPIKAINGETFSNYKINENGTVISKKNTVIRGTNNIYHLVQLRSDTNKRISLTTHRLVAITFLENPNNYPMVNHKDENKLNNHVSNLEWCTASYNSSYSRGKSVQKLDIKTGEVIATYNSLLEVAASVGKKISCGIIPVCKGLNKTAYGFKWRYAS
jgi:NUMOD4 motif./HNH endonuclease.